MSLDPCLRLGDPQGCSQGATCMDQPRLHPLPWVQRSSLAGFEDRPAWGCSMALCLGICLELT